MKTIRPSRIVVLSFNKLVDLQNVPMIFTGYSGPSLAMAPLATRKKVLMINAGAQSDKLGTASPYLVNTLPSTGDEVKVMVRYLLDHGKKTAAVLYENDAAGIGGRDDFVADYQKAGGKITGQEPTQFGQTDYPPGAAEAGRTNPDVLYIVITAGMPPLVDQLHQMNAKWLVAGSTLRPIRGDRIELHRADPHPGADRGVARTVGCVPSEIGADMDYGQIPPQPESEKLHREPAPSYAPGAEAGHFVKTPAGEPLVKQWWMGTGLPD